MSDLVRVDQIATVCMFLKADAMKLNIILEKYSTFLRLVVL